MIKGTRRSAPEGQRIYSDWSRWPGLAEARRCRRRESRDKIQHERQDAKSKAERGVAAGDARGRGGEEEGRRRKRKRTGRRRRTCSQVDRREPNLIALELSPNTRKYSPSARTLSLTSRLTFVRSLHTMVLLKSCLLGRMLGRVSLPPDKPALLFIPT